MRHKVACLFGLFISFLLFSQSSVAGSRDDFFYAPQQQIGRDIASWLQSKGKPATFSVEEGGFNLHSSEPVILVTLEYDDVQATFWLNGGRGDSILLYLETSDAGFFQTIDLPFSVLDASTWSVLGESISTEDETVSYRDCGDHLCAHIHIVTDDGAFSSLRWVWEVD